MNDLARRHLLTAGVALAGTALLPAAARAAMGPGDKFDLLLRNANVLDPSQGLAAKRDIGMRYGQIESIEPSIAPDRAQRVMDAGGRLVTQGADRPALPLVPVWFGHRHSGR